MMAKTLQLKIVLNGTKPPVWRRFLVNDSITFAKFHWVIQTVMGWTNSHLHEFSVNGMQIGEPHEDYDHELTDSKKIRLNELLKPEKQKFRYLYDFGDSWDHIITVEKIIEKDGTPKTFECIDGKRACPPEDCGGVWGYEDFLKAISNKNHPEHKEMLDWIGGSFDSEEFDLNEINKSLSKIK